MTFHAVRLTEPIQFDGRLDEQVYRTVPPISGFLQTMPDYGQPGTQRTEAWILFDANNIYVSCRCWDTRPESAWTVNEMRRDHVAQNDNFGLAFDTFLDRRNGYLFYANPIGGFADLQVTNEGQANNDFNPVWRVKTGRFDGGWTIEMQIPFKSLRYPPGASQTWGVQLRRTVRDRNEWTYATPLPISIGVQGLPRVSTAATLVGLEAPSGSRNLEIKPYGIAGLTSDRVAVPAISKALDKDAGFDLKYGISQNLTLDFTYNMDVAQVEVDEQQINLTRFNLSFPEKRGFFLEGRGLYEFGRVTAAGGADAPQLFFSRQIGLSRGRVVPIVAGARLTGKVGKTTFGALNLQTGAERVSDAVRTNFTILRVRRDILRRSNIGAMYTGRSASTAARGHANQAYGVDAVFSFYQNLSLGGFYARTETPGLHGKNQSYQGRLDYVADRYGLQAEHLFIGDAFNPEVGFVRRPDLRRSFVSGRFSPRPTSMRSVARFVWTGNLEYILNTSGRLESWQQVAGFASEFNNSDRLGVEATRNYDLLLQPFRIASGVTIPRGGYSFDTLGATYTRGLQHKVAGVLSLEEGGFYEGRQTVFGYSTGRIALRMRLSLEPSASINWVDLPAGAFTAQIYRARINYTFTPLMFFSGLTQYNSSSHAVSTNLRLRWEYGPGSELFVVYTEEQNTSARLGRFSGVQNRALAVKVNRLFRF